MISTGNQVNRTQLLTSRLASSCPHWPFPLSTFSALVTRDSLYPSEHVWHSLFTLPKKNTTTHTCYFLCLNDSISLITTLGLFFGTFRGRLKVTSVSGLPQSCHCLDRVPTPSVLWLSSFWLRWMHTILLLCPWLLVFLPGRWSF